MFMMVFVIMKVKFLYINSKQLGFIGRIYFKVVKIILVYLKWMLISVFVFFIVLFVLLMQFFINFVDVDDKEKIIVKLEMQLGSFLEYMLVFVRVVLQIIEQYLEVQYVYILVGKGGSNNIQIVSFIVMLLFVILDDCCFQ